MKQTIKNGVKSVVDKVKGIFTKTGGKTAAKTSLKQTLKTGAGKIVKGAKTLGSKAWGALKSAGKLAYAHPIVTAVAIGAVATYKCYEKIDKQRQEFKADAAQNDDNISRLKADIQFLQRLKRNADGDNR